ncbi:TOMM precursor leader peptide-binding protein [Streptomonospora sediminis]
MAEPTAAATATAAATGAGAADAVVCAGMVVALPGAGLLRSATAAALGGTAADPARLGAPDVIAVLSDADDTRAHPGTERAAAAAAVPWLAARVEAGRIMIGPARLPDRPGCPTCAERRRAGNRPDAPERGTLRQRHARELAERPCPLLTPVLASAVGALIADEIRRLHTAPATARTHRALLRISVLDGLITRHPLLPDPHCPDCAQAPAPAPARHPDPEPESEPKPAPGTFRAAALTDRMAELERLYVDAETGLVQSLATGEHVPAAAAVARLRPATARHDSQHGYGRADDYRAATAAALAEALERWSGPHRRGPGAPVRAAYREVADTALDPRRLGLYPDHWYDRPGFPFRRFDPDRPIQWVWGRSCTRNEPVLVPESFAYYGLRRGEPGPAYECSNGCAVGSGPAEAVLHGLLEVAERDAFLTTWYTRMAIPRIDLGSARDRRIPVAAANIRNRLGYEISAYAATVEQGVPAIWAMAVDRTGGPDRPRALCGAAAHLDPERALSAAIGEIGPLIDGLTRRYDPDRAARLLTDPDQVRDMDDHTLLYGHPDAFERFAFLPADGPLIPVGDIPGAPWPLHDDLRDDLAELAGRYARSGLDVIAVDTTGPELAAGGFACAKVLVPGTASMTFGHRFRRMHGLPRLLSVPRLLGRADRDLAPADLNPDPHPFP